MDKVLENLAEFSTTLSYADLPANAIKASRERLIDSIGCAIGAHNCDTAQIGLALAGAPASNQSSGRVLGSARVVAADAAAFINSCMIRNLDFNDTYPGGHPSDSLGALFAVAPQIGATGKKLITAVVVAYEIFIRVQMRAQLREKGWDQGFGISIGAAAGLVNLVGLSREVARHAIAITAVGNVPMRATRAGQLSMWKGAATAYAVRNAVFGVQLAAAGMTGPEAPFVGRHGLFDLITGPIELPAFGRGETDYFIPRAKIKYWPVVYNMQAMVWAAIELRQKVAVKDIASINVETYWSAWHESGSERAKWDPRTRETADHSLPYILAWTLRHGEIDHKAFVPESYCDPSIRPLMNLVEVRVNEDFEKDFPRTVRMRVTAKDRAGRTYEVSIVNPVGHENNPVSDKELAGKFLRQCAPRLGEERAVDALAVWRGIDEQAAVGTAFDAIVVEGDGAGG